MIGRGCWKDDNRGRATNLAELGSIAKKPKIGEAGWSRSPVRAAPAVSALWNEGLCGSVDGAWGAHYRPRVSKPGPALHGAYWAMFTYWKPTWRSPEVRRDSWHTENLYAFSPF